MTFLSASNSWNCKLSLLKGSHSPTTVMLPFGRQDELVALSLGASASLLDPNSPYVQSLHYHKMTILVCIRILLT